MILVHPGLRQPDHNRQLNEPPPRSQTSGRLELQADHDRHLRERNLGALHRLLELHQLLQRGRVPGCQEQLQRQRIPTDKPDQVWDSPGVPVPPCEGVLLGRYRVNCPKPEH